MGLPLNSIDLEPRPRSLCVCESWFALGTSFIKNSTKATQAYPWVNPMEAGRHQYFEVFLCPDMSSRQRRLAIRVSFSLFGFSRIYYSPELAHIYLFIYLFVMCMDGSLPCMNVYVLHTTCMPGANKGKKIPGNWSYRWLGIIKWVLGIELGPICKRTYVLNC